MFTALFFLGFFRATDRGRQAGLIRAHRGHRGRSVKHATRTASLAAALDEGWMRFVESCYGLSEL